MAFKETALRLVNDCAKVVVQRSPEILTGLGITGMITATVLAVKMTPEAMRRIGKKQRELNKPKLTKVETVKAVWPCYVPTAVTTVISTGCLIGASTINYKRNLALAGAYALTETAFKDYKNAVEETISKNEAVKINDNMSKKKLNENPVDEDNVIITKKGNSLCCDITCGRYFRSDLNTVKATINELNERLINEQFISKNEFFTELGLEPTTDGYELGWDATDGLIKVEYSSQIASNGEPCLTINYLTSSLRKYRH